MIPCIYKFFVCSLFYCIFVFDLHISFPHFTVSLTFFERTEKIYIETHVYLSIPQQ